MNKRTKIIELVEENIGKISLPLLINWGFREDTKKHESWKKKVDKLKLIIIKIFCLMKSADKKQRRQAT